MRSLRSAAGLSQQALAKRARVTQPRISQIESGNTSRPLTPRMLNDLADALGVGADALVDGDSDYDLLDLDAVHSSPRPLISTPHMHVELVGRADDLEALVALVRTDARLVTLVGPGGVGKTQLALVVCREVMSDFPEHMAFVSLAACLDPGCVVSTVARAVGLRERDARPLRDRLLTDLPRHRFLLVLDNVEQAVSTVAELVADLLAAYPDLTVLVTSRITLHLRVEQTYDVRPLGVPDPTQPTSITTAAAAPAVALFVKRAREAVPGFALSDANAAHVAAICRRLDGLPLAIELAAARVRLFSPERLLRQLDHRLSILIGGARERPLRQQSLRASIAWSVDLLDADQQRLLRALAVFAGGFTLEAAVEVAHAAFSRDLDEQPPASSGEEALVAVADGIATLLQCHLLTRSQDAHGVPRFAMLETIQEFAREQLHASGEAPELRCRHLAWCLSLANRSDPRLFTTEEPMWLDQLRTEDDNLRAALGWAIEQGREIALEDGLRLASVLTGYWFVSNRLSEGRSWLSQAVDASAHHSPSLGRARVLVSAALIEQIQGILEPAEAHGEQGLALARALDDRLTIARALLVMGNVAVLRGDFDRAQSHHKEALLRFCQLVEPAWAALVLLNLGLGHQRQGNLARAVACANVALTINRTIGNQWDITAALVLLAEVARDRNELEQARALFVEALALALRNGSEREIPDTLSGLATVAVAAGDLEQGARLLGAAETYYQRFAIAVPPPLRPDWPALVDRIRAGLTADQFAAAWSSAPPEHVTHAIVSEWQPGK